MKAILAVFTLSLLSACASTSKLTCDESCAMNGMVCTGQSMSSGGGSSYVPPTFGSGKFVGTTAYHSSDSETFHCAKDASAETKIQEIRKAVVEREAARKKAGRSSASLTN